MAPRRPTGATLAALGIALALALFIGSRIAGSITALTGPAKALGAGEAPEIPRLQIREAVEVGHAMQEAAALLRAVALVDSSIENAKAVAGKLIDAISQPYPVAGGEARVSACAGIAAYPAPATNTDSLLIRADRAIYAAKALGKGRFSVDARVV